MKSKLMQLPILILSIVLLLATAFQTASAQTSPNSPNQSPASLQIGYSFSLPVAGYADSPYVKIYASRVDTFYKTYWINRKTGAYQTPAYYDNIARFNRSSFTIEVTDSASTDVVVKARASVKGVTASATGAANSWTTIIDDSMQAGDLGGSKEFSLVDSDSDLFDGVKQDLMIILTTNAHRLEYGNAATLRRRVTLDFVP